MVAHQYDTQSNDLRSSGLVGGSMLAQFDSLHVPSVYSAVLMDRLL